jgi:cation diffusion facilitator family transporter
MSIHPYMRRERNDGPVSADDAGRILLQKGTAVARRSTLFLVVLSIAKGTVGLLSGSIALLADAAHTVMDIAGSSVVWLGLRLSARKPSDRFPYGFYKAESICALIVCIIMIFTGAEILRDSIERFYVPSAISSRPIVIAVAIGSGIVSYFLARYKEKAGREINSQGLKVESRHSLADVLDSGLVCGGVVFTYLNVFWAEPLAAVIISIFLLWTAFTFGKDSILSLMDVSPQPEMRKAIEETIISTPDVKGVHALKIRRAGPFIFVEAHVELEGGISVEKAHVVADKVEDRVKKRFKEVDSMTVHIGIASVHEKEHG